MVIYPCWIFLDNLPLDSSQALSLKIAPAPQCRFQAWRAIGHKSSNIGGLIAMSLKNHRGYGRQKQDLHLKKNASFENCFGEKCNGSNPSPTQKHAGLSNYTPFDNWQQTLPEASWLVVEPVEHILPPTAWRITSKAVKIVKLIRATLQGLFIFASTSQII